MKYFKATSEFKLIIEHLKGMDAQPLRLILPDTINYQDLPKDRFFDLLGIAFDEFKKHGDTELIPHKGCCGECIKGCPGVSFIGNNSKNYLDIIFVEEAGELKELTECSQFEMANSFIEKKDRIYIDDCSDFADWLNEHLEK